MKPMAMGGGSTLVMAKAIAAISASRSRGVAGVWCRGAFMGALLGLAGMEAASVTKAGRPPFVQGALWPAAHP